jgi:hypothetical protein
VYSSTKGSWFLEASQIAVRNPHIKVAMEPSQSEDKLQVAVVSNTPPDIWQAAAQAVFRNEKSPKEALEQMCRDAVPIMANRTK